MNRISRLSLMLVAASGLALTGTNACAQISQPIVTIDPETQVPKDLNTPFTPGQYYGFSEEHGYGMVGWTFHLTAPLIISAVGWYDDGKNGLSRPFQVGLWQDTGGNFRPGSQSPQLLGDAASGITIPGGTVAFLSGSWRIVNLSTPLRLSSGYYALGGLDTDSTTDTIKYVLGPGYPNPFPTIPELTLGQFFYGYYNHGSTDFSMPTTNNFYLEDGLEMGPMLFTSVPESSTYAIFGVVMLGIVAVRRRRLAA